MDPRVATAPEALAAQFALQGRLVAAMGESFAALERVRALRKDLAARAKRLETALAAVNETLGTTLTSLDGADAAPTSIQAEAYARARADLDRLLAELK
jgi:hypothetical protein